MKLFIQAAAEQDVLFQVEWYADQGLSDIALRFRNEAARAIEALMRMPDAGPPKHIANPSLAGLRTWPIKGFDEFRVYYLVRDDTLLVVRILHGKRNTDAILRSEGVADSN